MLKILHFLATHLPLQSGYSIRSDAILLWQKKLGMDPVVFTSPDFNQILNYKMRIREDSNGIPVYNWVRPRNTFFRKLAYATPFIRGRYDAKLKINFYLNLSSEVRPEIVHSHSPASCAVFGDLIARQNKTPFVYEARGVWEDTAVAEGKISVGSADYEHRQFAETVSALQCNALVAISECLKRDFISRGVPEEKIFVVPNGVDTNVFSPSRVLEDFKGRIKLHSRPVIGYIGAVRKLEGLRLAVEAMPEILKEIPDAALIVVGGGSERPELEKLSDEAGLKGKSVFFFDEVPHEDILGFYTAIDVFVLPRINTRVNQLVTPLKPLEAMAMAKAVLASDVGGLKELVEDGRTGMLFPADNKNSFVRQCLALLKNPPLRQKIGATAREWAARERQWCDIAGRYVAVYNHAIKAHLQRKVR